MDMRTTSAQAPLGYLLHLADTALVLGQRNAEWCGHGPALEEDIALANMSLDLIGQARLLYQYAAERINADPALAAAHAHLTGARVDGAVTEDTLAYFRDTHEFRNGTLAELPHHGPLAGTAAAARDYATTIVRNFLYSALMVLLWERLEQSTDERLAAIAAKSLKEVRYHLRHSRDWLLRLGDGTDESHRRTQAALDHLLPHTQEFWTTTAAETQAAANGAAAAAAGGARHSRSTSSPQRRTHCRMFSAALCAPVAMCTFTSRRLPLMPIGSLTSWPSITNSCGSTSNRRWSLGMLIALAVSITRATSFGVTSRLSRTMTMPVEFWPRMWLPVIPV